MRAGVVGMALGGLLLATPTPALAQAPTGGAVPPSMYAAPGAGVDAAAVQASYVPVPNASGWLVLTGQGPAACPYLPVYVVFEQQSSPFVTIQGPAAFQSSNSYVPVYGYFEQQSSPFASGLDVPPR
jgi:hypothetical protein